MATTMAGTMATIGDGISGNGEIMATTMAGSMATTRDGISGLGYGDILVGSTMGPGVWHSTTIMSLTAGGKPVR